jgi:hypothetical protein
VSTYYFSMNKLLIFLILLFLFSCKNNKTKSGTKLLDFKSFTIETPESWKEIESRGVDSYVGGIQMNTAQAAGFDLGLYSSDLSEFVKINIHDTTYAFDATSETPPLMGDSNFMEKIKKCKVIWDTIDGYRAKLVIPINSGFGVSGIYFDSLWQTSVGNIKFELSGNNLSAVNEMKLRKAFKTLQFRKRPL